ncbi:MAG TPA: hypothetical protein VIW69_15570 [Candidatus Elarobacter sp.]
MHLLAFGALVALVNAVTPSPTFAGAGEQRFVAARVHELHERFPTTAAARRGGYFRYTDEDRAGIIAYANLRWQSDEHHPSQLWYDARGRLIGADFSRYVADRAKRPALWGLSPDRWTHFIEHVHFGARSGSVRYGAVYIDRFREAGGNPRRPTVHPIVRLGFAKNDRDVRFVFYFPELWVASVWLVPNPLGAFADTNPNVPVHRRNARDPHVAL